jgi:hypothetical protein
MDARLRPRALAELSVDDSAQISEDRVQPDHIA